MKKICLILILLLTMNLCAWSDAVIKQFPNGKYGVVDNNGKTIVEPLWDDLIKLNGYIKYDKETKKMTYLIKYGVKKGNKWGIIESTTGNIITVPKYDNLKDIHQGLQYGIKENGKWGVIHSSGKVIIQPIWDDVDSERDSIYYKVKRNGKWGMVDKTEKIVVDTIWDDVKYIYPDFWFIKDGKWNILSNDKVENNQFDEVVKQKGFYTYKVKRNGKWGWYNFKTKIEPIWDDIEDFHAVGEIFYRVKKGTRWGILNKKGEVIFEPIWNNKEIAPTYAPNRYIVKVNDLYGLVDKQGKIVVEPIYSKIAMPYSPNFFFAYTEDKTYKIIDKNGKIIFDSLTLEPSRIWEMHDISFIKFEDDLWAYYDSKLVKLTKFTDVFDRTEEVAFNVSLLPVHYEEYGDPWTRSGLYPGYDKEYYTKVYFKNKVGLLNRQEKVLVPWEYEDVKVDRSGIHVKENGKWRKYKE